MNNKASAFILDSYFFIPVENGFAALTAVIFVFSISALILSGFTFVSLREVTVTRNSSQSVKSYYAAESGIEDAVYRIVTAKQISSGEILAVGDATGTITVTASGPQKTIIVDGFSSLVYHRIIQAQITRVSTPVGFHYGIQVGDGGVTLGDGAQIIGDVFSNGDIKGAGKTKSTIQGTAQAATSSQISDIKVTVNAYADKLNDCTVSGNAYYFTSITNCTVATSTNQMAQKIATSSFPITPAEIAQWKTDAATGGTLSGYNVGNNQSASLGPVEIIGNMTLGNSVTLTMKGTVWVTGAVSFGNKDTLKLDQSFGSQSGLLLTDGAIDLGNSATLLGSGQSGSYFMLMSLAGPGDAITLGNDASSSVIYAPNGIIDIGNGLNVNEATGYGLNIGNSATVTYQQGLLNANFTSGPTANWVVQSWKEVP